MQQGKENYLSSIILCMPHKKKKNKMPNFDIMYKHHGALCYFMWLAVGPQCKMFRNRGYSWCNRNRKIIIYIKQKPFMNSDIGLYGKLTKAHRVHTEVPDRARTVHALSLWQLLCSGDGVGLPLLYLRKSWLPTAQASLVSSHYGLNNGPPHSRMFKDLISMGLGQW